jgi:uncharacterized membrane protein YsdA (DUF1294 family)/cold shock CspA family protein
MRFEGTLTRWNDDRGFGFIEPAGGGETLFVHIKAFPAGTGRPSIGQRLTFDVETGSDGRKRARSVQFPVRPPAGARARAQSPVSAAWTWPRLLVLPAFAALYVYVVIRWGFRPQVLMIYAGTSLLALLMYALDKSAARSGRWRTSEQTLHAIGLVGGWPGALLAQQWLRHKTSKQSFIAVFWVTVALNVAAFVGWHAGVVPVLRGGAS